MCVVRAAVALTPQRVAPRTQALRGDAQAAEAALSELAARRQQAEAENERVQVGARALLSRIVRTSALAAPGRSGPGCARLLAQNMKTSRPLRTHQLRRVQMASVLSSVCCMQCLCVARPPPR